MRVLTLMARHGTERYPRAVADMRALFDRQMPEIAHELLVIDNALPPGHDAEEDGVRVIGGANAAWEFSAWDHGIAVTGADLPRFDFVHLATSAFRQLYVRYLDRFDADMLGLLRGRAAAVGHVDCYGAPVTLFGCAGQCWLRSSFVLLPPVELRLLGALAGPADARRLFSGDPAAPFRNDAPLCPALRHNIINWLTGPGTGQGTSWHSRFTLSAETLPLFERKTMAILNEQLLTQRLCATGCAIVDATWLASVAEGRAGRRPLGVIPDWRVQLRERDTDAAEI